MSDEAKRHAALTRRLQMFADYIKKAVYVETLCITLARPGVLRVEAKWADGMFDKEYELAELPRLCRTRRAIIGDILDARQPLKD